MAYGTNLQAHGPTTARLPSAPLNRSAQGYDLEDMGLLFLQWYTKGYWGAHNALFDIGNTTRIAIERIRYGEKALYTPANGTKPLTATARLCV